MIKTEREIITDAFLVDRVFFVRNENEKSVLHFEEYEGNNLGRRWKLVEEGV